MANCITRHIPNALTCMNLFSGCIACVMAFHANFEMAMLFIVIGAVFDFLDWQHAYYMPTLTLAKTLTRWPTM